MNNKEINAFFTMSKKEAERALSQYDGYEKSSADYQDLRKKMEARAKTKVRALVEGKLKLGDVRNEWDFAEPEAHFLAVFQGNYDDYLYAYFFLYHWGMHVYSTGQCLNGAQFMIQASTCAGYWKGARERDDWLQFKDIAKQTKIDRGKKVGEGRAFYFQPVREELVRLLISECPAGGWRFKTKAAEAVSDKLQIFIDTHGIDLKADNLESTILRWSSEKYPDVKAAFDKVVRKPL